MGRPFPDVRDAARRAFFQKCIVFSMLCVMHAFFIFENKMKYFEPGSNARMDGDDLHSSFHFFSPTIPYANSACANSIEGMKRGRERRGKAIIFSKTWCSVALLFLYIFFNK